MFKAITALSFAFILAVFVCDSASAEQRWGDFKKDQCTALGVSQYSAVLWDIPWGKSWEEACKNMPATIEGQSFASPLRCRNTGQMWGEFEVSDPSCAPRWGDWRKEKCVAFSAADKPASFGFRRYAAILWEIPAGTDWLATCQKAAVTLTVDAKPYSFPRPHICATADSKGITAAVATGLTVAATGLALPTGPVATLAVVPLSALLAQAAQNVGKTPLNVWGNVFIPDGSCNASNSTTIAASDTTGLVTKTPTAVPAQPVEAEVAVVVATPTPSKDVVPAPSPTQATAAPVCDEAKVTQCKSFVQDSVPWSSVSHDDPSFRHWQEPNLQRLCHCTDDPARTIRCFQEELLKNGDSWEKAIDSCAKR